MDAARPSRLREPLTDEDVLAEDSPAPAIVYLVVGAGLAVCMVALLFARPSFDTVTIAVALLLALPFLLFARLALARPGPDAVVAGVVLLSVGCWGAVSSADSPDAGAFVRVALSLIVVQLAVFAVGAALRVLVPRAVEQPTPTDVE